MKNLYHQLNPYTTKFVYKTGKKSTFKKTDWYDEDFVAEKTKQKKRERFTSFNFSENNTESQYELS